MKTLEEVDLKFAESLDIGYISDADYNWELLEYIDKNYNLIEKE